MGRRVPVGARLLSACAKTFSSSRDAFIAACVAEQFRIANPKAKIWVAPEMRPGTRADLHRVNYVSI